MTELLALSVDVAVSPSIRLKAIEADTAGLDHPLGWGFGWYPSAGPAAMVVKDPTSVGKNALTHVLSDWERFASTIFVAHLRGAAKRTKQQDTHPFQRTHAGRDWILTHNGDLRHGFRAALPIDPATEPFSPIGRTDTEHLFCWLLNRLRELGAATIDAVPTQTWVGWLRQINALGTLNLVITDGRDLIAYSDAFGYRPLRWTRHMPPSPTIEFAGPEVEVQLGEGADSNRTAIIVSTTPLSDSDEWHVLRPGQLLCARLGAQHWLSDAIVDPASQLPAPYVQGDLPLPSLHATPTRDRFSADSGTAPPREPDPPRPRRSTSAPNPAPNATRAISGTGAAPRPSFRPTETALERAAESLQAPEVFTAALTRELGDDYGTGAATERVFETVHETVYTYETPIRHSAHMMRLRPEVDDTQELLEYSLDVAPAAPMREFRDVFGNHTHDTVIRHPYDELNIVSRSVVRVKANGQTRLRTHGMPQRIPLVWMPWQRTMMTPYLLSPELPETQLRELSEYAMSFVERQDYDLIESLKDINLTIYRDYEYATGSTQLATTPFWVYAERRGVCQDFANLFIALCRLLDVPARYRTGYIFTGGKYDNERQGDASHAWAEVYIPRVGWRGFDPTNGVIVADDHVRLACGRNYRDATPTAGTIYDGGGGEKLEVKVTMHDVTAEWAGRR